MTSNNHGQQPPSQPGQWQPAYPPAPPIRRANWFARHKILTGFLALLLIVGVATALGGGGDSPATSADSAATESTSAAKDSAEPKEPEVDPDDVGNESNPVTIVEGKAFAVRKFAYAPGWKVTSNEFRMELPNLKVTNNRGERDAAVVQIKYMKGTEVRATIDCSTDQILPGQTVTLNCFSVDKKPSAFDQITINDTF